MAPQMPDSGQRVATMDWTGDLMWVSLEAAAEIDKENKEMWRKLLDGTLDVEALVQEDLKLNQEVLERYKERMEADGHPVSEEVLAEMRKTPEQCREIWARKLETARQLAEENLSQSED